MTQVEFNEEFDTSCSTLKYNSVVSVVPPAWRSIIKYGTEEPNIVSTYEKLETEKSPSKVNYWNLVAKLQKIAL